MSRTDKTPDASRAAYTADPEMPMTDSRPVQMTVNGYRSAGGISRRQAMQWVLGAVAASALPPALRPPDPASAAFGQEVGRTPNPQERASDVPPGIGKPDAGKGYGVDPNLTKVYAPGDFWPLTFTPGQKRAAAALADVILPKDHLGPAASELGVPEMLDEWVSAPYPVQQADRAVVLPGLAWLDAESNKRFGKPFADLAERQQHAICDDVCDAKAAGPAFRQAAAFFVKFRSLCAGAYYATPAGWRAIGYVGNVALGSFDGPPPEVLQQLGVTQTVA